MVTTLAAIGLLLPVLPRWNKSPAFRPAPVCAFHLWDAARPSRTAPPFQPLADGDDRLLDKREQIGNISSSQQRCSATGASKLETGRIDMVAPLLSLFFLGCFWIAGSLALQELYDSRRDIRTALSGRGGIKRVPRASF
jgi:hypothetical protein